MALDISQILAASYDAVLTEARKPANQWEESAFLHELERIGGLQHKAFGPTLEETLDYRANPGGDFLATDMTETSLTKTDVLTAASYAVAELSVPVVWSKGDDAKNPTENQKVNLVKSLAVNAIASHDDLIEEGLFAASATDGFLSLPVIIPTSGQGTVGGINAATETFWRNQTGTYVDDTDMEAAMTTLFTACSKGSGSKLSPKLIVSGAAAWAVFASTQQAQQRFGSTDSIKAGFKQIQFMSASYVFSQYGGTSLFFVNPTSLSLSVSKQYFRDMGKESELPNANAFVRKIYSALQLTTNNKSRLGVLSV